MADQIEKLKHEIVELERQMARPFGGLLDRKQVDMTYKRLKKKRKELARLDGSSDQMAAVPGTPAVSPKITAKSAGSPALSPKVKTKSAVKAKLAAKAKPSTDKRAKSATPKKIAVKKKSAAQKKKPTAPKTAASSRKTKASVSKAKTSRQEVHRGRRCQNKTQDRIPKAEQEITTPGLGCVETLGYLCCRS